MGIKFCLAGGVIAVVAALGWTADHYHAKALAWRTTAHQSQKVARQQAATISGMNQRQQQLAALDKIHTEALNNAKNTIAALQHDVDYGRQRLQLHANCPALSAGQATGTARVDDAARARPSDAAIRNYFTLRERIETARQQISGLQDYIRQQCLK